MPPLPPSLSITLPRNFTFHYTDGECSPKTPERADQKEEELPPPPRIYRLKTRQRLSLGTFLPAQSKDVPIPTIETSLSPSDCTTSVGNPSLGLTDGFLAPFPLKRFASRPKTPIPQILTNFDDQTVDRPDWNTKDELHPGDSITRPGSACSNFSDSSDSSDDSSASFHSLGGSCTSPESEASAPFMFPDSLEKDSTPCTETTPTPCTKPVNSVIKREAWTTDMDRHLWTTYMLYLQDPTVTPFSVNPGSAPPLGVRSRVAREAKRSWRGPKHHLRTIAESSDTIQSPDAVVGMKSGNTTPTRPAFITGKPYPKWPKAEAGTRKRLKELCRNRYSPSPTQQRFLHSKRPKSSRRSKLASPFSKLDESASFSTRELGLSLSTSSSSSLGAKGPLLQLSQFPPDSSAKDDEWFGMPISIPRPPRVNALRSGIKTDGRSGDLKGRLASAFSESDVGKNKVISPSSRSAAPFSFPHTQKRRAQHHLEDGPIIAGVENKRMPTVEELFGKPAESSHRRVRSRGFSLGDVAAGSRLTSIFTPPSIAESNDILSMDSLDSVADKQEETTKAAPRLASPYARMRFQPHPKRDQSRHYHRSAQSLGYELGSSIADRLKQLDYDDLGRKRFRG
ncbi:MAG: hypothetical protein M1829_004593 [Trizodia sp. TS-e1964]|nr:MAG: hypothetical protein M1829_004593 [Trizodia sp. TS-e1964]